MNTRDILHEYCELEPFKELIHLEGKNNDTIFLQGLSGSGGALTISALYSVCQKPILIVLPNKDEALYMKSDLENLLIGEPIYFIPETFLKPFQYQKENAMAVQERIETLSSIRKNNKRIIVTYGRAISEFVIDKVQLTQNSFEIAKGQNLDIDFLLEFLELNEFERVDFVFEPGQFSLRGGIVDLFSFAHEFPFRIELDGDIIESIRSFDVNNQLSLKEMAQFSLVPKIKASSEIKKASIFEYLEPETLLVTLDSFLQLEELAKGWETALQNYQSAIDLNSTIVPPHPKEIWMSPKEFVNLHSKYKRIFLGGDKPLDKFTTVAFRQEPQPIFKRNFDMLKSWLAQNQENKFQTLVFSDNSRQIERLQTILKDTAIEHEFIPIYVGLSGGFLDHDAKLALVTEHQLFDKYYRPRSRQQYSSSTTLTLRELKNLKPGDFVTHIDHGIGRFAGLEKMEMNGVKQEVVRLVYRDNDLLYLSVNSLHKISKYSGKDGTAPSMHKLGSGAWEKQKRTTKKKVKDIARELIALYAKRKKEKGFAFAPDNYLQLELEASFFYEDTPDQAKATEDVKRDMENEQPMDRLVCGDVGFGKTEVAMRAAFKAVCDSKQVAILVPTTILAQQHYRSFKKRFAGFPIEVDYLNRFKSTKEQKETLEKLKNGKVDVIIGTHRILGKDIEFKDLGLMIIDEEQKFGVGAKEKLKAIKVNIDTLTLTATPIPRTLHFSLMGARDLSVMNTPPPNRQPVHTELATFNRDFIGKAVSDELNRGGQVFIVHSRVKDIHELANIVSSEVPGSRVCIAHGQMDGHELEDVMVRFIEGEYDVLVATTIIESGLDIPNANTIIINNAHMFGLSDLHQMRGRVGRSNIKAFCYLVSPPISTLPEDSRKRLRTLEEFSELGSGFQVAMRDLDIRGAGNLLGAEQSGFISEMGFDMYHKILDEAVRELKNEEFNGIFEHSDDIKSRDCQIDTHYEILIPSTYVTQTAERLSLYSELSNIESELQLRNFSEQLTDRFGKLPTEVVALIDSVRLKWAGKDLGMEKIVLSEMRMRCYFPGDPNASVYQSNAFAEIMGFVAQNQSKFVVKQTDKALIVQVYQVGNIFEALHVLGEWKLYLNRNLSKSNEN
jgi:transcription-repair coupling factor (superfamily II helicase)